MLSVAWLVHDNIDTKGEKEEEQNSNADPDF
jgi:hypothetical protein